MNNAVWTTVRACGDIRIGEVKEAGSCFGNSSIMGNGIDDKFFHLWNEGFYAILVALADHMFGEAAGILLLLVCSAMLVGFIAIVALFGVIVGLAGFAMLCISTVQFLDAVCQGFEVTAQSGTALAWKRRHWKRIRAWGDLGRQFGAWDYEYVAELMSKERRRGVLAIPKANQRKNRKNEKRRYARTNNGNHTGLGGS